MTFSKRDFRLVHFEKGSGRKKYNAVIRRNKDGRLFRVPFGDTKYQQYEDSTGLGLYSHLNHYDWKRRDAYRSRHRNDDIDNYTPGHFSWFYLW